MSRRVLKWAVPVDDAEHRIPGRYVAAHALGHDVVNVWTEVLGDPETAPAAPYRVYGTGHDLPASAGYVATVQASPFVWHLFQMGPAS